MQLVSNSDDKRSSVVRAQRVLIGVCTLNEADNIGQLIDRIRESLPTADILVVDDDSSDDTGRIVAGYVNNDPAVMLSVRTEERGLGFAIRHAMEHAIEQDYTFFLNLDGDFSHDPTELPGLLERAKQLPPVDVVIGSRYIAGGSIDGWSLRRQMMSRIVNRFAALCLRLPLSDSSGSMRCYRVDSLRKIGVSTLKSSGYSVLEEVLVRLHRQGAEFAEVPITFTERQQGQSKLTMVEALRSAWRMMLMAVGQ